MGNGLRPATDEEYKRTIVNLLKRTHEICEANGIRYTVGFGTALGTVRHKGFIPWDDDIDICMPRTEFDRFVKAFTTDDGRYYVLDSGNTELYYNNISRICDGAMTLRVKGVLDVPHLGAFVDIFFLDKWPEKQEERDRYCHDIIRAVKNVRYALPRSSYATLTGRKRIKALVTLPLWFWNHCIVGLKKRKKERDKLLRKYQDIDTGWIGVSFEDPRRSVWFMKEEAMNDRIIMPFEDIEVYVPKDYDDLLTQRYGNWKELPPVEQRVAHHHYTAYWNDRYTVSAGMTGEEGNLA